MTVADLIEVLRTMPPTAAIGLLQDGATRTMADRAYLARGGHVVLCQHGDVVYYEEDKPHDCTTPYNYRIP